MAAGAIGLAEAAVAVRRRGQYMQEAVPVGVGAMAAILGLDLPAIEAACREAAQGQVVSPANINSPGQVVIAGHKEAVERASALAKAAGAKRAVPLPVSAPFHCALMAPAQERLARDLASVAFHDPAVPLVNNVDALVIRIGGRLPRRAGPPGLGAGTMAGGRPGAGARRRRHRRRGRAGHGADAAW